MRRALASMAAAAAFSVLPLATAAQDDSELARVLAQRGWFDLAEDLCNRIEKSATPAMANYVRAEIRIGEADREPDLGRATKSLDEAAELFRRFADTYPSHPMALDARASTGWVRARQGRLSVDASDSEPDPVKLAQLGKQALQAFQDAEKVYGEAIEKLESEKGERAQDTLMDARLARPRVLVDHAKLPGVDDAARKQLLLQAKAELTDFEFDYGDRPIAFEAMLEGGKCMTELGEYRQAEAKLRAVFALRKRLAEAKIPASDYHNRIIYGAYLALAQTLERAGRLLDARNFVDQILRRDKTLEKEWAGPALRLEKAEILFKMQDPAAALSLASEIISKDPQGRWGFLARAKMKRWEEGGARIQFTPEQLITAADSSMDRDLLRDALRDLRRAVEACRTDADRRKYEAQADFKMGQCFQALGRNYEAAFCYEKVFTLYPTDANAAKSCYEVVRCYNAEFALSGDKRDDDLKERFLSLLASNWPHDPAARNLKYVQAEKLEKTGNLRGAAELYRQVGDDAEAYESALVAQGYCYYADASRTYEKHPKDPTVLRGIREAFQFAEEALKKFLARAADPSKAPVPPEQQKQRAGLVQVANQQLAYIYMHEAVGRPKEALELLAKLAKDIPPDDERIAKIWATEIQAYLSLKQLDEAVRILDMMFDKFPDVPAVARACKSVAIKLDGQIIEMTKAKADPAKINENLRRISRYYAKWLNLAPALNMRITMQDVLSVAETLYMIAKQINGLDENTISFLDLKGKTITEAQYFRDAAFVHALLTEGKVGKLPDRDKIVLMTRLARCHSFTARDVEEWTKAKDLYEAIVKTYHLLTPQGTLDASVLQAHPELLGVYVEEGYVFHELGKRDARLKFQFDNASTVFSNVLRVVQPDSEPWWQAKYMVLRVLFDRGAESDAALARVGLENLRRSYPDFDGDRFRMKGKFWSLKDEMDHLLGAPAH